MNKNISYLPKIDALRAIAAFMVLIAHYLEDLNSSISFAYGRNGVQIFFTISGFLITLILLTQKNNNTELPIKKLIISFMFKRAFRLFPIYYILIITLLIFSILGGLWICEPHNEWYYFIYAQNYLFYKIGFQSNLLNHTWSLAVEEQFYILWPFLIFFIPKRLELVLLIVVFFIGIIAKYYFYYSYSGIGTIKGVTFIHFDTLAIGSLLAYCIYYKKEIIIKFLEKYASFLFILTTALSVILTFYKINAYLLSLSITLMSIFIVFLASSTNRYFTDVVLNLNFLNYFGKISYGIYLYHKPVPFFFNYIISKQHVIKIDNPYLLFFIYFSITMLLAIISWNTVEKYFLKYKDKLDF